MSPNRRIDREIQDEIQSLVIKGWSAAQIERRLALEFKGHVPSPRTIQRVVKSLQEEVDAAAGADRQDWSLLSSSDGEGKLILPVLKAVIVETEGRKDTISKRVAGLVVKVRRVAPDVDPWDVYDFAVRYIKNVDAGYSPYLFDLALSFEIWQGPEAMRSFLNAGGSWGPAIQMFTKADSYDDASGLAKAHLASGKAKKSNAYTPARKIG